jgi:hypothetical protein
MEGPQEYQEGVAVNGYLNLVEWWTVWLSRIYIFGFWWLW